MVSRSPLWLWTGLGVTVRCEQSSTWSIDRLCVCVLAGGAATLCYCSVCPSGNTTCELKPNGQCFAAVEQEGDEWVLSHGCLAPVDEEGGIILQVPAPAFRVCPSVFCRILVADLWHVLQL